MADLYTYGDLEAELNAFGGHSVPGTPGGSRFYLNRAQRYIQDFYNGEWSHFFIRDYSVTVDSTGYYITLPTDCYKLLRLYSRSLERSLRMGESDFRIEVSSPSNLESAPTRKIKFWKSRTASSTMYLSYFRTVKDFAASPSTQVPDLIGSGEAVLEVAKWLLVKDERNANLAEKQDLQNDAIAAIRRLKSMDDDSYSEFSAPDQSGNNDAFEYDNYNLDDGGESARMRWNPLLNE